MTVPAVLSPGALATVAQPRFELDGGWLLRPWELADAPAVQDAFDVPDIRRWHLRRIDSVAEAEEWTSSWGARWAGETDAGWAITREECVVGQISMRTIFLPAGQAQMSYWVVPAARGHAVASRACRAVSLWAFEAVGFVRLYLTHSVQNEPSCRVAERSGFQREGVLRSYMVHEDGWHDMHVHGRLASDGSPPE